MTTLPPMAGLRFGRLDAHDEAVNEPDLLIDGFYDFRDAAAGVEARTKYLLLGPKGAGKTAILEHLQLTWDNRYDRFFSLWDLRGFPISDVRNVKTGQSPGLGRTQSAWEFLLLLRLLDSMQRDQSVMGTTPLGVLRSALIDAGLLTSEWRTKVTEWARSTAKVTLPFVELGIETTASPINLLQIVDIIKRELRDSTVTNFHVVALDGLDSFFFETESQWESLSGLVQAAEELNRYLRTTGVNAAFVVALRSDIYDVLPSAETNKFKNYAVQLDWSAGGAPATSPLWELVHRKVRVSNPSVLSLPEQYFKWHIPFGEYPDATEFIIEYTRRLPRDLVALLSEIQAVHPGPPPVPGDAVLEGVRRYCENYFEGEIFNNLAGVLPRAEGAPRKVAAFRDAMRTVPTRFFTFDDVQADLSGQLAVEETTALLRQMFEVGAIGVHNQSGGSSYVDFIYRKVGGSGFTKRHGFVLHNALTRAWNRPWKKPTGNTRRRTTGSS